MSVLSIILHLGTNIKLEYNEIYCFNLNFKMHTGLSLSDPVIAIKCKMTKILSCDKEIIVYLSFN